jgi:hypothetical protein
MLCDDGGWDLRVPLNFLLLPGDLRRSAVRKTLVTSIFGGMPGGPMTPISQVFSTMARLLVRETCLETGLIARVTPRVLLARWILKNSPGSNEKRATRCGTYDSGCLPDFQGTRPGHNPVSNDTQFVCPVVLRCSDLFLARE